LLGIHDLGAEILLRRGVNTADTAELRAWNEAMVTESRENRTGEFITQVKDGYDSKQAYKKKVERENRERIDTEARVAEYYVDISVGDFVVVVDDVTGISTDERKSNFRGIDDGEMKLPVWIGKATSACSARDPNAEVSLHRYRVRNGNINTGQWFAGVQVDNSKWIVVVQRSAIALVHPVFRKNKLTLQVVTKKALGELVAVPLQWKPDPRNGKNKLIY
jgi:hypothetical protein